MLTITRLIFACICLVSIGTVESGVVPQIINYQGRLTGVDGAPIAGTFSVTFTIYSDSSAGVGYFQETKSITTGSDGLFSTILGTSTQLLPYHFNDTSCFLGVKVDSDSEILPRTRITSVPYAYHVYSVNGAGGGTIDGSVSIAGSVNSSGLGTFQSGANVFKGLTASITTGHAAVLGASNGTQGNPNYGVRGVGDHSTFVNYGVYGEAYDANNTYQSAAIYGKSLSRAGGIIWAGFFDGWVYVTGNLSAGSKSFRIDDPMDPANSTLQHACVESDEYKNIYDGVVTLDAGGQASVTLPVWFDALNSNFRYQLTAIGSPAPNLHIAQKLSGAQFRIAGGQPGMEVSWMITGVRKDAFALAHPIEVQKLKPEGQRGKYLHPVEHGVSEELGVEYQARAAAAQSTVELDVPAQSGE